MTSVFNRDLLRDLAHRRVVLFLGAGVSSSSIIQGNAAYKGWPDFLSEAAKARAEPLREQVINLISSKDYLLACQLLQDDFREEWQEIVTAEYGRAAEPSNLHRALLSLEQRIIVTTNFDKLIETAWASEIRPGSRMFKVLSGVSKDVFRSLRDHETPYLIKIHGSVDNAASLVFSRSEYIRMAFGNPSYSSFLDSLLLNHTILFVGFSMDDPAISSLMEMYALHYPEARPHYIITPNSAPENLVEINKKLRKLSAIPYDPTDNHSKLPSVILEISQQARNLRREIIAEAISAATFVST